ncbi:hypothetical protein L873DRAFT_1843518 [Choiromyces venosus 120613-1]|uniref:Tc1-like transposase DDE domain-containing protein n=1 Tax=Choiromyces venosus 120613-1 TaxID=1336337 RepID=A0A3N4JQT3_9PEZI|nr:hypothetical protein L873DRAFT_1843518 [Choiromyces venosus 120613-1]
MPAQFVLFVIFGVMEKNRALWTLWTDESTFSTTGFGHRPWVLRRPEEEFHPDCIDETWESGRESVMIWGGFCGEMKSELQVIPPGVVEDGAPGHQRFAKYCWAINQVEILPWPPQSPDLNLIEALWGDMETELGETFGRIKDIEVIIRAVKAIWDAIEISRLDGLIRSMPERLEAVIAAGGMATAY